MSTKLKRHCKISHVTFCDMKNDGPETVYRSQTKSYFSAIDK